MPMLFFDCNASGKEIEKEIPYIRDAVRTPKHLKLALIDAVIPELYSRNSELESIAQDAADAGIKYSLLAKCSTLSNSQTADEVAGILNQAYQSPLYQEGEDFRGKIFYKANSEYVERK